MSEAYEYLTSSRSRARVESIVEKFTEMEADHRIRLKRLRLSSNDPIETAPDECTGLNLASSAGAVPIGT